MKVKVLLSSFCMSSAVVFHVTTALFAPSRVPEGFGGPLEPGMLAYQPYAALYGVMQVLVVMVYVVCVVLTANVWQFELGTLWLKARRYVAYIRMRRAARSLEHFLSKEGN